MKLKKTKRILSASVLISICILTGCAGNAAASVHNGTLLSAMPASDIGTVQDSSAVENPGYVDYSVYEAYGLSFDEKMGCYTYNGDIVEYSRPRKPRFRNFGNRRSGGRKPIDWLDYHVSGIVVLSSP